MSEEGHKCIHESKIILLVDHVSEIGKDTKSLIETLKGNGKPGLITQIALQGACMKKLHERLDAIETEVTTVRNRTWGVIISVALLLCAAAIKYIIGG